MTPAERSAAVRGRHRIRLLESKGVYVCSKRFCPFSGNYQEGVAHVAEAQRA